MNRNETFGYFKVVREKFWAHFGHSRMWPSGYWTGEAFGGGY